MGSINDSPLCRSCPNEVNTDEYISNNNRLFYEVVELETERERLENRPVNGLYETKEVPSGSQMQRRRCKSSVTFSSQIFLVGKLAKNTFFSFVVYFSLCGLRDNLFLSVLSKTFFFFFVLFFIIIVEKAFWTFSLFLFGF